MRGNARISKWWGGIFFAALLPFWALCVNISAAWQPLAELKAPDPCENAWFGFSVSVDNDFAAISAPWKDNSQGAVYIYKINDSEVEYMTTLFPPDLNDTNEFGYSVCMDSNRVVVGTYMSTAGEVYVFDYNGAEWSSNPAVLSVAGSQSYFGTAVSINGNKIVVGARGVIDQKGAAYVFEYNGASWAYKQTLTDPSGANAEEFGYSVAIDGDVIVVGARWDKVSSYREGSVCVFRLSEGVWSFEQKIENLGGTRSDEMGRSVAVSGDTFVVGVYKYDYGSNGDAGAAFVYKWDGSSWIKEATLYSPSADISYGFGNEVALYGNSIIAGEMYYDGNASNSGAAFLFERNGSSWSEGQKLEDPSGDANDYFGRSVAMDGEVIIAGAYKDDGGQIDSGAAFLFVLLIADLNRDGRVNFEDFAILANQWLQELGEPSADIAPPPAGDNTVNMLDLKLLTEQWLKVGSAYIP